MGEWVFIIFEIWKPFFQWLLAILMVPRITSLMYYIIRILESLATFADSLLFNTTSDDDKKPLVLGYDTFALQLQDANSMDKPSLSIWDQ